MFQKISIIGPNGSGKTTLARRLGKMTSLPIIHVDSYIWGANWQLRDRELAQKELSEVLQNQTSWVADGYINYSPKEMLTLAELVIYLDYSKTRQLFHNIKRWLKHRKNKRDELPEGCEERFSAKSCVHIMQGGVSQLIKDALEKYKPKNLVVIKSPRELDKFLRENF